MGIGKRTDEDDKMNVKKVKRNREKERRKLSAYYSSYNPINCHNRDVLSPRFQVSNV